MNLEPTYLHVLHYYVIYYIWNAVLQPEADVAIAWASLLFVTMRNYLVASITGAVFCTLDKPNC